MRTLDSRRKKDLGAFYTHQGLTDLICAWSVQAPDATVLEPSFGGCGFLRSTHDRLTKIGSSSSVNQIFGCDIDTNAFLLLADVFEQPVDLTRYHEGDFLDQQFPSSWPKAFDAVVGNPPYLPYRKIDVIRRETVLSQLNNLGLNLDRRASLWAYFVALSVPYTATGGRAAWVLPSSFLYANFSNGLRKFVAENFEDVRAFELKERQFLLEGTEEKTVVLLCKGKLEYRQGHVCSDIPLDQCAGVKDLQAAIQKWDEGRAKSVSHCGTSVFDSLSERPKHMVARLRANPVCKPLGDFLRVRIGLVTGNNAFFLLSDDEREALNLDPSELQSVLPRFQFAQGMQFSQLDHSKLLENGGKGYLVSEDDLDESSDSIKAYLARYPQSEIDKCSTFKKRPIWCRTDDEAVPDAFFPVMQHNGPRLVLNQSGINCTNSVHRVYFKPALTKIQQKMVALSLLSTFSQISAEACGRSYGSGALKHEPREAEKIEVLMPELHPKTVSAAFTRVDRMLRDGNLEEVRQFVDQLILGAIEQQDLASSTVLLRSGLKQLRFHRHR